MNASARAGISTVIAVLAGLGGLWWLIAIADHPLQQRMMYGASFSEARSSGLMLLLPLVLVMIAAAAIAVHRSGALALGGILTAAGAVAAVLFLLDLFALLSPGRGIRIADVGLVRTVSKIAPTGIALIAVLISGALLMTGLALLIGGTIARAPKPWEQAVGGFAAIGLLAGPAIALMGAGGVYNSIFIQFRAPALSSVFLVCLGVVLFAAAMIFARFSPIGMLVAGLLLTATVVFFAFEQQPSRGLRDQYNFLYSGVLGLIGAALIGLGVGGFAALRRLKRTQPTQYDALYGFDGYAQPMPYGQMQQPSYGNPAAAPPAYGNAQPQPTGPVLNGEPMRPGETGFNR